MKPLRLLQIKSSHSLLAIFLLYLYFNYCVEKEYHGKRILGQNRYRSVSFGFGSYRVDSSTPTGRSLKEALLSGINFIDTSTNYSDGNSEILIGEVIKEIEVSTSLRRSNFIIASKAGYIQGKTSNR
ncbi:MAG: aldo/keto reductase [Ignavibacteriales bacterium]|nr:aldo/keto reductase [Ignavibacteriales bacterium]